MGLTNEQKVNGVIQEVAWLTIPDRLRVIWALLTRRASYFDYNVDQTSKWRTYEERPVALWRRT